MKEINVILKSEIDFSNAQVGDDVFCTVFGIGKIIQIDNDPRYPVKVDLVSGEEEYTKKGHLYRDDCTHASLYYFNPETQEILYSRPEPGINWAEYEGKLIEIRDKDEETWVRRRLCKYAAKIPKPFICYNSVESDVFAWKQARLIKEDS